MFIELSSESTEARSSFRTLSKVWRKDAMLAEGTIAMESAGVEAALPSGGERGDDHRSRRPSSSDSVTDPEVTTLT